MKYFKLLLFIFCWFICLNCFSQNSSCNLKIKKGDTVLFNKAEGSYSGVYKYGIVEDVKYSADNHVRAVIVKYRNANEEVNRTTLRAVRSLVIIHRIDELDIMEELGKASFIDS